MGDAVGGLTQPQALALAIVAAGSALLNDLDTPSSTASRAAGRVSRWVSSGVQGLARASFELIATPLDRRGDPIIHRGLTHTLIFVAAVGSLAWATARLGSVGVGLVALVATVPAARAAGLRGFSQVLAALGLTAFVVVTAPTPLLVGAAVAVGLLSHDLLDGCTTQGVPLWWPLRIRGRRWRRVGTPRFLRFHTGGRVEPWALGILAVVAVLLLPPVLEIIKVVVYNLGQRW